MFIDVIGSVSVSARQHRHSSPLATARYQLKIKYGNGGGSGGSDGGSIVALGAHSHGANRIHCVTLQFGFAATLPSRTVSLWSTQMQYH